MTYLRLTHTLRLKLVEGECELTGATFNLIRGARGVVGFESQYGLVNHTTPVQQATSITAIGFGGSAKADVSKVSASASLDVARVQVKTSTPSGTYSGQLNAQALGASAQFIVSDRKQSFTTVSVGAEAHLVQSELSLSGMVGPVHITAKGSAGVGAAIGGTAGAGEKGFTIGGKLGWGGTVGLTLTVSWK